MNTAVPSEPDSHQEPVEIPHTELSPEALRGVVESYVLREGTDYGEQDFTLEQKVTQVLEHLVRRKARVVFDPATETVTIVEVRPS